MTAAPPDYWTHQSREHVVRAWIRTLRHDATQRGMPGGSDSAADRQAEAIKVLRQEIVAIIAAHKAPPQNPEVPPHG